ncbi:MAG: glycoside hydrolase family 28 protein [Thermoflavifilum sp.]|nr:glycoside hydrolase family 28 protein [Thermoflavifilum sp.]
MQTIKQLVTRCFIFLIFSSPFITHATAAPTQAIFNIRDYGAKGDGKINDAPAINRAIEAAHAAGGGIVFFPAGVYVSGSIHLQSHITLLLSNGSVILASENPNDYDAPEPNPHDQYQDFGHSHWHNSLIWGENLQNIAIMGTGMIDGKGLTRAYPSDHKPEGVGNKAIALKNCHNVILKDFKIYRGGWFGLLLTGVDNLTIDGLMIDTNRDGMDIDACKNVHITNCIVNSPYDDGICLKSSYGLGYNKPTENVTISNCIVSGDYVIGTVIYGTFQLYPDSVRVPRTGRIKFGTESNGGFKNITITNCVLDHCGGLALETVDGGDLEDVLISNITMKDIVNMPIFIRLGARLRAPKGTPVGHIRRVNINHIIVYHSASKAASTISGIPNHPIEDVRISDMQIYLNGGGTADQANITPAEKENAYPEPTMFGTTPSYGFYVRHVKGIEFRDIDLHTEQTDARPAIQLDDVHQAIFRYLSFPIIPHQINYRFIHSSHVELFQCAATNDEKISLANDIKR